MGNHKGRSKGCTTCVKRRIKCDQTRPTCLRCLKSKTNCLGYRDCFIEGQAKKSRGRGSLDSDPNTNSFQASHGLRNPANVQEPLEALPQTSGQQSSLVCRSLPLLSWKNDIMISYLIENSRAGPIAFICQNIAASNASDSTQRSATKQCLLALATTLYGTGHSQKSLLMDGQRQYGEALNMVTKLVQKPSGINLTEAMASIYALSLFETISPTRNNQNPWLHHVLGLEQIFRIHGPSLDAPNPLFVTLLKSTRLIMIVAALHDHRPSLMAEPEWSVVSGPSPDEDPALFEISYTLDTLAQLAILYPVRDETIARIQLPISAIESSIVRIRTLLDDSLNLLTKIQHRRTRWLEAHPFAEFSTLPQAHVTACSSQPYPFEEVTQFTTMHAANSSVLYHTAVILILQFITSICQFLPAKEQNELKQQVPAAQEISFAVDQILKSMDYHVQSTRPTPSSGSASFYLLLPLRVAYQALSNSSLPQEASSRRWLAEVFEVTLHKIRPWTSNKQLFSL